MKKDERRIVNKIVPHLEENGFYCFVDQDTGNMRIKTGWDFLISKNNRSLFIEAKTDKNKLTDYQDLQKSLITFTGNTYLQINFFLSKNKKVVEAVKIQTYNKKGKTEICSTFSFNEKEDYKELAIMITNIFNKNIKQIKTEGKRNDKEKRNDEKNNSAGKSRSHKKIQWETIKNTMARKPCQHLDAVPRE